MLRVANPPGTVVTVWQVKQSAPLVRMWLTSVVRFGMTPVGNDWPVWQLLQVVEVISVWSVLRVVKPPGIVVVVWHLEQSALAV